MSRDIVELLRWSMKGCLGLPLLAIAVLAMLLGCMALFLMVVLPVLFLGWLLSGLGVLTSAILAARDRAWWKACGLAVVAAFVAIGCSDPLRDIRLGVFLGDTLHLALMLPMYRDQIAKLPPEEQTLVVFNRGGFVTSSGIAYDASDQILLSDERRSLTWKHQAERSKLDCAPQAVPLWGHYYSTSFGC